MRRISARRLADGARESRFDSSLARMNASIGLAIASVRLGEGTVGGFGGENNHSAYPCFAAVASGFISSIALVRAVTVTSGIDPPIGIFGVLSPRTYWISRLLEALPGVIAGPCL